MAFGNKVNLVLLFICVVYLGIVAGTKGKLLFIVIGKLRRIGLLRDVHR